MSSTLSRTYRPATFAEIVNQNHVKITLQNELATNTIAHAYLFAGPRGIGKTTTARIFAKSLNCTKRTPGESEPCNTCGSCVSMTNGNNMDMIEIDAASHTGVDNVRAQIIETARFVPHGSKYKVYIIDEVHMLSISAFNALLKTIEEPPAHVVFILATTELHKVPETIISRCQRFDFKKIDVPHMVERLAMISQKEGYTVAETVLKRIAVRSGGYTRDAESMLGQLFSLGDTTITEENAELLIPKGNRDAVRDLIVHVFRRQTKEVLTTIVSLAEDGVDMELLMHTLTEAVREIVVYKMSGRRTYQFEELFGTESEDVVRLFQQEQPLFLLRLLESLVKAYEYMRFAPAPHYPLEIALLQVLVEKNTTTPTKPLPTSTTAAHTPSSTPTATQPLTTEPHPIDAEAWQSIVTQSAALNHSIQLALKGAEPLRIEGNQFVIRIGYDLYRDRLSSEDFRSKIESVIASVLGTKMRLVIEKGEVQQPSPDTFDTDAAAHDLIKNFDGTVV